jgi:hypothetical protein
MEDGNYGFAGRMVSSGLLSRVALVRTDVSVEPGASFIRVTKIGELGTTHAATSNRRKLQRNTKWYFFAAYVPSSPIFVSLMKEAPGSSEIIKYQVVFLRSVRRLLVAACVVPSSPILSS